MRILTVGNMYPPHHFGGYEQVWASAVEHLRDRGHQVRVLAVDYRHPGQDISDETGVARTLHWYWRDHDFASVGLRERLEIERHNHDQLRTQIDDLRPDVLSFWSMGGMSHSLIEAGRRRGIPIVAFVHDEWLDYGRGTDQWTRMFAARRYRPAAPVVQAVTGIPTTVSYGAAGRYVFVSEFIRQRALKLGLGLIDTAVAHSGIAPTFGRSKPPPHEWRWRLLHVGRLHPDKGIEDAVRCLEHLPEQATLTFAGAWDPRDESALGQVIRDLSLQERVRTLGQLPAERIADLYRSSDVLLFPVRWEEPWGLVPLESMACGCPVIATGRGGSAEYLRDGDNCLLVPAADPVALAATIKRMADDRELIQRVRIGGLATAPCYTEAAFNCDVERHLHEKTLQRVPVPSAPPAVRATVQ